MDELCRADNCVDIHVSGEDQRPTNSWFRIAFLSILVLAVGGWTTVAAKKDLKIRHSAQRIVPAKSNLSGTLAGLKIVGVAPNGAAAQAGLKYGDVIIAYNRRPITTEEEIYEVMRLFNRQQDQTKKPATAELSFYRDGDMTVRTIRVPMGRLGIYTREWTFAGDLVEDAIVHRNDYASAQKYADKAARSGNYTDDQILHMRMLCLNNERDGDKIREVQVDELYRKHLPEKLRLFANYDLLYNKRYRAGAAIFDRYLKINRGDVSTELSLASCYVEIEKYDEADALLARILTRPKDDENAPTEYGLSVLSIIRAKIYLGQRQYGRAQERFQAAFEHHPDDPYYTLGFLYCAARRDIGGEKAGEFEAAYRMVSAQSPETEELIGYHIDALRAFVLVKQRRISAARAIADKWRDSSDARQYVPIFWRRFPDGVEIIDTWNLLLDQQAVA
jgi:tetratricopeptide (TPR) repeat protein